jgi:hypothetical protein
MEKGFYKLDNDQLLHAPNFVYSKKYELLKECKDKYAYPVDGWRWFETRQEAIDFYGIVEAGAVDMKRTYTGKEVREMLDELQKGNQGVDLERPYRGVGIDVQY